MAEESILEEAQRLVHGDRGESYGHPSEDFARLGELWGAFLGLKPLTAKQVGLMLILLKINRENFKPKHDNRVDIAGYAETLDMIAQREEPGDPPPGSFILERYR